MKKETRKSNLHGLYCRNGIYQYRRVIPKNLRELAGLREIKFSLETDDHQEAVIQYTIAKKRADRQIKHLKSGKPLSSFDIANADINALKEITDSLSVPYKSFEAIKNDPDEFQARLKIFADLKNPGAAEFRALLGAVPEDLTFQECIDEYLKITSDHAAGKTDTEKRKRENPIRLSFRKFEEFLRGKHPELTATIKSVKKQHAREYRQDLLAQQTAGKLAGDTANKRLLHVRKVFNEIIKDRDWDLANPFSGIAIKAEDGQQRHPYSTKFIREKILAPGALDGMNDECQAILLAAIATGCGPKELVGLAPEDIQLDHETPHIVVRANVNRQLKQKHRGRNIPLVGIGLEAFKRYPDGFPRYRSLKSGADTLSANIRAHFQRKELIEGEARSMYSFRHSFMDRMREAGIPNDVQDYLMGHKNERMGNKYGHGYTLVQLKNFLEKMPL